MLMSFDSNPAAEASSRRGILGRATKAGITLPSDFWPRLESSTIAYLESNRMAARLGKSLDPDSRDRTKARELADRERADVLQELRVLRASQCEQRKTALSNARAEFGSSWFDRFLK